MAKLNSLSQSLPQLRRLLRHCAPELRAQRPLMIVPVPSHVFAH
jgi:hypothetical protein